MDKSAADALFWPMTTGALPPPGAGGRVLYAGARMAEGVPPPERAGGWVFVQFFKPWADALAAYDMQHSWPGEERMFNHAFVLGGRQADETRGFLANAALRLADGGWLAAAAANDEGGKRLPQEFAALGLEAESAAKYHARIVWGRKNAAAFDAVKARAWADRAALQPCALTGFISCPGLFSWDRIDAGSLLLAQHLPDDMKGRGADFGCGYGYLGRVLADRYPGIKSLICLDADARAVAACARNLAGAAFTVECRQADLTGDKGLPANLDWIVMNPPFHEGKAAHSAIGGAFIRHAARSLHRGGMLYMVANNRLPYENELQAHFGEVKKIAEKNGYKIYCAVRKD